MKNAQKLYSGREETPQNSGDIVGFGQLLPAPVIFESACRCHFCRRCIITITEEENETLQKGSPEHISCLSESLFP